MIAIKNWPSARERCGHMMYWCTKEPIHDPLVQLSLSSKLTVAMLEISFSELGIESKKRAVDYSNAVVVAGLRSHKMACEVLSLTDNLERTSAKRQLAVKLAAMCGNSRAAREHRRNLENKVCTLCLTLRIFVIISIQIRAIRSEISAIPDRRRLDWGRGQQIGTLVPRTGTSLDFNFLNLY